MSTPILYPVGRLVMGSLSEPQTKDAQGAPLTIKTAGHPDFGKPTQRFFFAVAYPKQPGHTHWSQTDWGAIIWGVAHAAWPQGQTQLPAFAFKVDDGDSTVPKSPGKSGAGRVNAKTEGFPGHWIVSFSSSFAPKVYDAKGAREIAPAEVAAIKTGYFIQVYGTVAGNGNPQKPGIYINHDRVAFSGYGDVIRRGVDPASIGFGASPAPAGMTTAPPAAMSAPAPAAPPLPPAPPTPAPVAPPAPPAPPTMTAVQPHPGILNPTPPPPPVPAVATPGGAWKGPPGSSHATYAAAGWSDAQMRAAGLLA